MTNAKKDGWAACDPAITIEILKAKCPSKSYEEFRQAMLAIIQQRMVIPTFLPDPDQTPEVEI